MIRLQIDTLGQSLLLLPDGRGVMRRYHVRPWPGARGCILTRLDTGDVYRVRLTAGQRWICGCKARRYSKKDTPCKHILAVWEFLTWLASYTPEENALEQHYPARII